MQAKRRYAVLSHKSEVMDMDLISQAQLTYLAEYRAEVCVSLYMPSFGTGPEKRQNPVRFKNLVRSAGDALEKQGLRSTDVGKLLSPAQPLFGDDRFWSFFQSDGFCAFISPGDFMYFRVPVQFRESVSVMDRYYIKPLLGIVHNDNRFFLISLGLEGPKLYQCSRFSMNELRLENIPENFKEATKYNVIDRGLQFHTHTAPSGTREGESSYHAQGGGEDGKKTDVTEYFKKVAHGVASVIGQENAPLLFAGLDHHFGTYRKANSYSFFIEDDFVATNPDDVSREELHKRAVAVMGPYFLAGRNRAIEAYHGLAGSSRCASGIVDILPRAIEGRVETLFIAPESSEWGTFDPVSSQVHVHTQQEKNDQDLIDLAALNTYLKGGAVYEIPTDADIPSPAAVFRY
jgi:hypothetical protein